MHAYTVSLSLVLVVRGGSFSLPVLVGIFSRSGL